MEKTNEKIRYKVRRSVAIPMESYNKIKSIGLCASREKRAILIVEQLIINSIRKTGAVDSLIPMPKTYLKKVLTEHYNVILASLLEAKVLDRNNSWSSDLHICMKYGVIIEKPEILNELKVTWMTYYRDSKEKKSHLKEIESLMVGLKNLNFNVKALLERTDEIADNTKLEDFLVKDFLPGTKQRIYYTDKKKQLKFYYGDLLEASKVAHSYGQVLVYDNRRYSKVYAKDFIEDKKKAISFSYKSAIGKLERGELNPSRNRTNNRLDSTFTNLSSELMKIIMDDNDLVQIDVCNSQFTILANILPEELQDPSTQEFKEACFSGKLYESIQQEIGLSKRSEAKQLTFETLFSSYRNHSKTMKLLKDRYPEVMKFIYDYKKFHGSNQFCISLQKFESELFIDNILPRVLGSCELCITKHDSIIVRRSDLDVALEIVQKTFSEKNFKASIKID